MEVGRQSKRGLQGLQGGNRTGRKRPSRFGGKEEVEVVKAVTFCAVKLQVECRSFDMGKGFCAVPERKLLKSLPP